jgi:hypothetical protein
MASNSVLANFTKLGSASAHGPVKFTKFSFTGPAYVNSGTPATSGVTGLAAGLKTLIQTDPTILMLVLEGPGVGYTVQYNSATDLLRIFDVATPFAEVVNAVDLSAVTFRATAISY